MDPSGSSKLRRLHKDMTRAFYYDGLAYSKINVGEWIRKPDLDAQPLKVRA